MQISYYLILIGAFGISLSATKNSSSAIASYDHNTVPKVRITKQYNPKYSTRFHPNDHSFCRREMIHVKSTVKQPYYKYLLHQKRLNKHQIILIREKRFRKKIIFRKKNKYVKVNYAIHHYRHYNLRDIMYLHENYPIWSAPYRPGVPLVSSTNALWKAHQAIKVMARARSGHHIFYEIESAGHIYGWIPERALKKDRIYQMPFKYYSQLYPLNAPDACEAVSLRMALSVKGHDPNISMKKFISQIPRSKNPNQGYTASPYKYEDGASIYPKALAKYGRKYDKQIYPFTGITTPRLISELKHGNPVVFEGAYRMKIADSDHTLVLIGYGDGELEFADPYYKKGEDKPISWVSIPKFEHFFHQQVRGARAVVVK